jgi:uncharacterized repeat protein (TIGR01451 family)
MTPARRTRGTNMIVPRGLDLAARRTAAPRSSLWALALALGLLFCASASAAAAPVMHVVSTANTTAAPGGTIDYFLTIGNVGDAATSGPLTLTATLPVGLTAASSTSYPDQSQWDCSSLVPGEQTVTCTNPEPQVPTDQSRTTIVRITADVAADATGVLTSRFEVTGGGADPAQAVDATTISAVEPEFGIESFDGQTTDAAGGAFSQAGGHPFAASTTIFFNTLTNPNPVLGHPWPVEPPKNVFVDLPPGFVGDPTATNGVLCTQVQLANSEGTGAKPLCPTGSQVGVTTIIVAGGPVGPALFGDPFPVYNLVPPPDVPARFGFNVLGTVVILDAALRTGGDYGLTVKVQNIPEGLALIGTSLTFWGAPADPSHDLERSCPGEFAPSAGGPSCATDVPRRAFLRNPTSCTAPGVGLETVARSDSWFDPGDFKSASFVTHDPPAYPFPPDQRGPQQGTSGCADVPFEPSFSGGPTTPKAGAPSGYAFDLTLPQSDDPDAIGTADLKKAVVTLPLGVRVSPPSARGLGGCAPAQIALKSAAAPSCPGSSKIGTIAIDTPLLDEQLTGSIYLAKPRDNPFGSLLSVYLVAKGRGLVVKLAGRVDADPITGQLTATFDDNPQLPFSRLHVAFRGGSRAALVNPPTCGTHTTHAVLFSWSGATVASDSTFEISRDGDGTPCPPSQFSPDFVAGVNDLDAGGNTTFDMQVLRSDDDEELRALTVHMPLGLLAKVAGVPLCKAAQARAGTCGEGSRIGSVLTGAGAGFDPFYLPGRVYLTEAYNGGPFGLSIVVPAVAGPFDLGNVVVRASVRLDKRSARLRVVSDPLPTILEGIRLQIRDVRVAVDRPRFMINPTSCLPKQVDGTIVSTAGTTARVSERFQVRRCNRLPLRPRMKLIVGAKGRTSAGSSTPLIAKLTQSPGQANLASVNVTLPLAINALLPVVTDACTIAQFEADDCARAWTGNAVAVTPLLDKPLRGKAYFVRRTSGRGLPNLVVALRGQVAFDLVGRVVIPSSNRLSTRFDTVPDVPIKSFTLRMFTGENGAVGVATNLCAKQARRSRAGIVFRGQNGAVVRTSQRLRIRGCRRAR